MSVAYTEIEILTRREKLSPLLECLLALDLEGITVTETEGNGQQHGQIQYEDKDGRMTVMLIPKISVQINTSGNKASQILKKIIPVLRTDNVGDGKIFITNTTGQIYNIRTQEEVTTDSTYESNEEDFIMKTAEKPMTKVTIITRREKFNALRKAMVAIGVSGMTVSEVNGSGRQHGLTKIIEGVSQHAVLLPKIKVDIVVCEVPVQKVIDAAIPVLHTGNIGDGKIFTTPISHAVRIRTGETDADAI